MREWHGNARGIARAICAGGRAQSMPPGRPEAKKLMKLRIEPHRKSCAGMPTPPTKRPWWKMSDGVSLKKRQWYRCTTLRKAMGHRLAGANGDDDSGYASPLPELCGSASDAMTPGALVAAMIALASACSANHRALHRCATRRSSAPTTEAATT